MKFNKTNYRKLSLSIFVILFAITNTLAQIGLPGDGDVDDVPEAPIDDWVLPLSLIALMFGVWILSRKRA